MNANLIEARRRIAACLMLNEAGNLVQRQDHLNLAGLGLTTTKLIEAFDPQERGLPRVSFADLEHLRYLDLTGNELVFLPQSISHFMGLRWLGLNFNRLVSIDGVEYLGYLERLYLRGNKLESLPFGIGLLTKLLELDLTGNAIRKLPQSLGFLEGLDQVALEEKSLVPDQRSSWEQKGWISLRKHLKRAEPGVTRAILLQTREKLKTPAPAKPSSELVELMGPGVTFHAAKLILIGDRGHGKTCLQKALRGVKPQEKTGENDEFSESTEGMNRALLRLGTKGELLKEQEHDRQAHIETDGIDFHIWDMGGQHDYRHMHQMLFSPQAIYLAVMIPRGKDDADRGLHRWLELVQRRTQGKATVLVVCTRGRKDASLKIEDLQREFQELKFQGLHVVDSLTDAGISELRQKLAQIATDEKGPHAQRWQAGWPEIFSELQDHRAQFLTLDAARKICLEHEIVDADAQEILIRTGHLIGTWLWREDTPAGKQVVVLKPEWLNRAVARVLDDETAKKKHGLIDLGHLKLLWLKEARDGAAAFPADTHAMLLQLMEINELAYRPKRPGAKHGDGDLLLVTQMVRELPPEGLDQVWPEVMPERYRESRRTIIFADPSGALQPGEVPELIFLLIFRLRSLSLGHEKPEDAVHWRRGLVVRDKNQSLARIELKDRELHITLRHLRSDSLFDLIDTQVGADDDECWNGLKKIMYAACGAACALEKNHAHHGLGRVSVQSCHESLRDGESKVNCASPVCGKRVFIDKVLARDVAPVVQPETEEMLALLKLLASGKTDWQKGVDGKLEGIQTGVKTIRENLQTHATDLIQTFSTRLDSLPCLFSVVPITKEWWKMNLSEYEMDVTIWCEWSLAPVPFFGEKFGRKPRGTVRVKLPRGWVRIANKMLPFATWALRGWLTGGLLPGGGFDIPNGLKSQVTEWSKTLGEVEKALKDESNKELQSCLKGEQSDVEGGFSKLGVRGFGSPQMEDKQLLQTLRDAFAAKDESWGGLKAHNEESRWYWRHPKWETFGRKI